uniref:Probable acetyltransferase n=1 Tax=Leptospirillum ferrodiazotrophum TaxID=412449 RepID=C6HUB7_9BACT|nr:MAG: probable acetyltransferase [Leptospirillum ferrodiazotrophum]
MSEWRISALEESDLPAFLEGQARAFTSHDKLFEVSVWTQESVEECRSEMPHTRILVAKGPDGEILGGIRGRDVEGVWVIRKLFVVPEARKNGLGTALMERIEGEAPSSCHKLSVCTMLILGENVRLFLGLGYFPDFLMPDHYNHLHLICFRKDPSQRPSSRH